MEKFIIIGDNFGVKITKIKYALKKNIDNQNWKWPKIKKTQIWKWLKNENNKGQRRSQNQDFLKNEDDLWNWKWPQINNNSTDEEDLKMKTIQRHTAIPFVALHYFFSLIIL